MEQELKRRKQMFNQLIEASHGLPTPSLIRELGIYGGAQGIYRDVKNTSELTEDGAGVTVSILHTGRHYDDDTGSNLPLGAEAYSSDLRAYRPALRLSLSCWRKVS